MDVVLTILEQRPGIDCTEALSMAVIVRALLEARPQLDRKRALIEAMRGNKLDIVHALLNRSSMSVEDIQQIFTSSGPANDAATVVQEYLNKITPPAHATEEDKDNKDDEKYVHRFGL